MAAPTKDGSIDFFNNPANKEKTGKWRASIFIFGYQFLEKLAYYGVSTNLVNYFKNTLNERSVNAANNVTNWSGTCFLTPVIGAFLADAYWGKYWTIIVFSVIYVMGLTILMMCVAFPSLKPSCDSTTATGQCHPTELQIVVAYISLYMVALGFGATRPCVSSFGGDQFDHTDQIEKKQRSSFFNWSYMLQNVGMLLSTSAVVWLETNISLAWGYGVSTAAMAIGLGCFLLGTRLYRFQHPVGSSLTKMCQVIIASIRKYDIRLPYDQSVLYELSRIKEEEEEGNNIIQATYKLQHTDQLRFFDKSAVETQIDRTAEGLANPWRLCTVTQVEELKCIVRLLPIWASGIMFATILSQMSAIFILQGNKMDPHLIIINPNFKVPSSSLLVFNALGVIVSTPIYDWVILPTAKKLTGYEQGFTQLQRMGIGLAISVVAIVSAGVLEHIRLNIVRKHNYYDIEFVPVSIFWQIPQYFLVGFAEIFILVGQIEFFYDQAPDSLRSLCSALSLTAMALGNFFSSFIVTVVTRVTTRNGNLGWIPENINKGHLDYYYGLLTLLSLFNCVAYVWVASYYKYKGMRC
ncbi:protein NRT1/ PTR FAMILY 8.1-like [Humulus lupulus]|uniref:protein NRT1/ PTR FAMILY 8.1-like n=1 Tax=Humulus lupulus TaxID=3486 RepID=UPI002B40DD1B|nr:protein NRT1/ PTR FAMILY 8.1-like [Humulus lupulus]